MQRRTEGVAPRRLSKTERRRQLLETAHLIVREEGADRLSLGHLAERAGVSKPVAYDHFGTRSALLIELFRSIDMDQKNSLRTALSSGAKDLDTTAGTLAAAYVRCVTESTGVWHALGAALGGSAEKDTVYQELLEDSVQMFANVLEPHSTLPAAELQRRCAGLVGAGEALSALMVRGTCSEAQASEAFAALIRGGLTAPGD
ncbi:transcriptional regulator, TetR family [Streptomyces sp. Ncost-T6T-1]|uniref:TetR/AcrR family transcriptional regulator n=1 Tax=Streptomyces sp. Ncost-T6T-1 TaxID=1100828 RepID=UPI0008059A68|nr:TetR/AcrR family transcriptional regulator [Streptomyces sp. Ncost-T6T-1]SBU98251.1 transcriptional regulator, TetR family [Streptomyces sp. Ncost-T6T-1]